MMNVLAKTRGSQKIAAMALAMIAVLLLAQAPTAPAPSPQRLIDEARRGQRTKALGCNMPSGSDKTSAHSTQTPPLRVVPAEGARRDSSCIPRRTMSTGCAINSMPLRRA